MYMKITVAVKLMLTFYC